MHPKRPESILTQGGNRVGVSRCGHGGGAASNFPVASLEKKSRDDWKGESQADSARTNALPVMDKNEGPLWTALSLDGANHGLLMYAPDGPPKERMGDDGISRGDSMTGLEDIWVQSKRIA